MFVIQFRDLEEGNGARWNDLKHARHETREAASGHLRRIRSGDNEEWLVQYRIVEEGSAAYYSQPTDALEY